MCLSYWTGLLFDSSLILYSILNLHLIRVDRFKTNINKVTQRYKSIWKKIIKLREGAHSLIGGSVIFLELMLGFRSKFEPFELRLNVELGLN